MKKRELEIENERLIRQNDCLRDRIRELESHGIGIDYVKKEKKFDLEIEFEKLTDVIQKAIDICQSDLVKKF